MSRGCVHARGGLAVDASGETKLCCMSRDPLRQGGRVLNIARDPIEAAWSSETRAGIAHALEAGEAHPNCTLCWVEEAAGRQSKRLRDNATYTETPLRPDQPVILDLKLGNTCNLKCRTCGSHSSSKWIAEEYETGARHGSLKDYAARFETYHRSFADENPVWGTLRRWSEGVVHYDFYGGEPMLIGRHWELLRHSIATGHAAGQAVHYNTNGTVFPAEADADLYRHFRFLDVMISVDGVEAQFEYMRHPAKWAVLEHTFHRWRALVAGLDGRGRVGTCITVSLFNLFDVDRTYNWFAAEGEYPFLNLVHWPDDQCITNLPDPLKPVIAAKLLRGLEGRVLDSRIENVLAFMQSRPSDPDRWRAFLARVATHDRHRGESFAATFPAYHALLEPYL